jgi:copper chaperone CopZ
VATTQTRCPASGTKGKNVGAATLHALVRDEFQARIAADADYHFCDAKGCDVVYFAADGSTITKPQIRVEVGIKEATGERPLCYCFGHSVATIKEELRTKGRSDALEDIRRKIAERGCACERTNPSGACCLGVVGRAIETARSEVNGRPPGGAAETISKVGTVLSAIVASACCWLPLVLLAFGVSGAGIAGALEFYRPALIAVTAVFLVAAFYFTYRPRKAAAAPADCCAARDSCCATAGGSRRLGMRALNKVVLWVVTFIAIAFLCFPGYVSFFLTGRRTAETAPNDAAVRTTAFAVEGMTCEGCSALVGKAIEAVPGVLSVRVDYGRQRAVVFTAADCPDPTEAVLRALDNAGCRGEVIADAPPPSP